MMRHKDKISKKLQKSIKNQITLKPGGGGW